MRATQITLVVILIITALVSCTSEEEKQRRAAERDAKRAAEVSAAVAEQLKIHDESAAAAAAAAAADKAKQEAAAAEAKKQAELAAMADAKQHPGKFLEVRNLQQHDKGIINAYRSVQSITVANNGKYPYVGLSADVEWYDAGGRLLGSTPMQIHASLMPGEVQTFSTMNRTLTSGTLQGAGATYKLKWKPADLQ